MSSFSIFGLSAAGSFAFTFSTNSCVAFGSNDSRIHSRARKNVVPNAARIHRPTPHDSPIDSVASMTPASFGSSIFARYLTRPAAPTMPNARARLDPTTSITIAPTTARMICVWMTGGRRLGVPRRRGRTASTDASNAATGRRSTAWRSSASCRSRSGVSVAVSVRVTRSIGVGCAAAVWAKAAAPDAPNASNRATSITATTEERKARKGKPCLRSVRALRSMWSC